MIPTTRYGRDIIYKIDSVFTDEMLLAGRVMMLHLGDDNGGKTIDN